MVLALIHFRAYVWGKPVTVVTDAEALRWLMTLQENNGKLLRWALRIQEFDVTVQHRAGTLNGNADGLSRLPQQRELDAEVDHGSCEVPWPEALGGVSAPPMGVRFAAVTPAATHGRRARLAARPEVRYLGAALVSSLHGPPLSLNRLANADGSLAARLANLTVTGAQEQGDECEEEMAAYLAPDVSETWDGHDTIHDALS